MTTKTVVTEKTLQAPHIRRINADLYLELPDGPLSRDWWLWVKDKDADDWEPVSLDRVEALCLRAYLPDVQPAQRAPTVTTPGTKLYYCGDCGEKFDSTTIMRNEIGASACPDCGSHDIYDRKLDEEPEDGV